MEKFSGIKDFGENQNQFAQIEESFEISEKEKTLNLIDDWMNKMNWLRAISRNIKGFEIENDTENPEKINAEILRAKILSEAKVIARKISEMREAESIILEKRKEVGSGFVKRFEQGISDPTLYETETDMLDELLSQIKSL